MKFEKLTIRNIASVAEAEIDFTSSPLAEARLFLINGPTGAGKSTLLDGVCLALFCTAPRLEGYGLRKGATDVIPDAELQLSSPLGLVRRGTSDAEATLVFEGNNGRRYRASWRVTPFVKGKKKGQIQGDSHTLTDLNSNESWDKVKEIKAIISSPEVVGLDFKRFCRTTMLAQGSFASFLSAEEGDKARILEKIIGIEQFSEIGKKIFERRAELRRQLDAAQDGIKGIAVLTDEEREEKRRTIAELGRQEKALREKLTEQNAALQWIEQEETLAKRLEDAQKERERLEEENKTGENIERQRLSEQWSLTAPLRELYKKQRQTAERDAEIARQKSALQSRRHQLALSVAKLEERREALLAEIRQNEQTIADLAPLMPLAEQAAAVRERSRIYAENAKRMSAALTEIENRRGALRDMEAEQRKLEGEVQDAIKTLDARQKAAAEAAENAKRVDFGKLRKDLADADSEIASLTACRLPLERYANSLESLNCLSERSAELTGKIETGEKETTQAEAALREAVKAETLMAETVETARRGCEESAVALRHKLRKGDKCPVCGREIEEIVPDEAFAAVVRPLEEKLSQLKTQAQAAAEKSARITAELNVNRAQRDRIKAETEQQRAASEKAKQQLDLLLEKCGLEYDETTTQTLEKRLSEAKSQREQTDRKLAEGNRLQNELIERNRELSEANENKALADKKTAALNTEKARISAETEWLLKELETTKLANREIETGIGALLPEEYGNPGVKGAAELATETEERHSKLLKANEQKRVQAEKADILARDITDIVPGIDADENHAPHQEHIPIFEEDRIKGEAMRLAADTSATEEAERINRAEKRKTEEETAQFHKEHPDLTEEACANLFATHSDEEMAQTESALRKLAEATAAAAAIEKSAKEACEEHKRKRPEKMETADKEALKDAIAQGTEQSGRLNRELGSHTAQLENDSANRRRHAAQLAKIEALEKEHSLWSDLDREFGGNNGSRFSKIACAFILEQLLDRSNFYLEMFSKRYHLEAHPDSTEIMVYDRSSDHMRAFNTLSGGESFMVSLALALGLSAFQDSNSSPDTLFIDEGFGTLSAECLDTVTETLERLQNIEGRRVGIISHVEALRDRISTRITLEPRGAVSVLRIET